MTGVNLEPLLMAAPIVNMIPTKKRLHGVSHGLTEAGYDIRIKQELRFIPSPKWKIWKEHQIIRVGPGDTKLFSQGLPVPRVHIDKFKGRFVLASTIEEFQMPNDLRGVVHDKSTWARQGVSVFNTVIEPGWKGFLTLEIEFRGQKEVVIPAGSGIAQVLFTRLQRPAEYTGKYQNQADKPIESIFEENTHAETEKP